MPFVNREEKRIEWRFFFFILVCDDVWRKEGRKEGRKGLNWIAGNWRKWVVWWTGRQVVKGGKQGKRARDGIKFDNRQTKTQKHSFFASFEVSLLREKVFVMQ